MGMHWLRRGERDLFRLPFVLHGHQEILQVLKRKPRKGNFENRTFDASVIFEAVAISLNRAGRRRLVLILRR